MGKQSEPREPANKHYTVDGENPIPDDAAPAVGVTGDDRDAVKALSDGAAAEAKRSAKEQEKADKQREKDVADGNLPSPSEHLSDTQAR
jgi:hypothetical protein